MSATDSHSFDVLGAISLTMAAAYVALLLVISLARSDASRTKAALILAAWFGAIVALSRTSLFDGTAGFGTIAVGAAIAIPVAAFAGLLVLSPRTRMAAAAAPLATLISLHAARIFGADFLWLQEMGRLGFPFAPVAGWGDIIVGIAALPIAARRPVEDGWVASARVDIHGSRDDRPARSRVAGNHVSAGFASPLILLADAAYADNAPVGPGSSFPRTRIPGRAHRCLAHPGRRRSAVWPSRRYARNQRCKFRAKCIHGYAGAYVLEPPLDLSPGRQGALMQGPAARRKAPMALAAVFFSNARLDPACPRHSSEVTRHRRLVGP